MGGYYYGVASEIGMVGMEGLIWLRIKTGGRHL